MTSQRLTHSELENSNIVSNSLMNRERVASGDNSYAKDIGLNPFDWLVKRLAIKQSVRWLDLCCGQGNALIEVAEKLAERNDVVNNFDIELHGIDLVDHFATPTIEFPFLKLQATSLHDWQPDQAYDLITCVHGLHYLGDKLSVLFSALNWLSIDGLFIGHLDPNNICGEDGKPQTKKLLNLLRNNNIHYNARKHLLTCEGQQTITSPWEYLGADDQAGPNFTGQPVVNSFYKIR